MSYGKRKDELGKTRLNSLAWGVSTVEGYVNLIKFFHSFNYYSHSSPVDQIRSHSIDIQDQDKQSSADKRQFQSQISNFPILLIRDYRFILIGKRIYELTIGFESISQVIFIVCFRAALMILPSYWHDGGSVNWNSLKIVHTFEIK